MFFRYNLYTIVWALVILALTLLPGQHFPKPMELDLFQFDKLAHAGVFSILSFLMIVGLKKQSRFMVWRYRAYPIAIGVCFAYGLVIELLQSVVPERGFELGDLLANGFGILMGCLAFRLVYRV